MESFENGQFHSSETSNARQMCNELVEYTKKSIAKIDELRETAKAKPISSVKEKEKINK
jgi:hypothetical protein